MIEDSVSHRHHSCRLTGISISGEETIGEKAEGSDDIGRHRFLHRYRSHKGFTYGEMGQIYSYREAYALLDKQYETNISIDKIEKFDMIMLLVQKEVAERFASSDGSKEYGITSVILQSLFDVKITRVVRKEAFTPMPKIDSAVVKMVPHKKYNITNFDEFRAFIHQSFSMRRKTLVNNLNYIGRLLLLINLSRCRSILLLSYANLLL